MPNREITMIQAMHEAIAEEMRRDPTVFLMGEDVRLSPLPRQYARDRQGRCSRSQQEFPHAILLEHAEFRVTFWNCLGKKKWL